jgi:hypothetical protein
VLEAPGFLAGNPSAPPPKAPADVWASFVKSARISDGTFLEVKRLARVDLSGVPVQSIGTLPRKLAVAVMRKEAIKPPAEIAAERKRTMDDAIRKLVGSWEGKLSPDPETEAAVSIAFLKNGQIQGTSKAISGKAFTGAIAGTWTAKSTEGETLVATVKWNAGGTAEDDLVHFQFQGTDEMMVVDKNASHSAGQLLRKGSAKAVTQAQQATDPGAPAPDPGSPTPTPGTPPAPGMPKPPAVPADQSLKVAMDTLQENFKFIAPISVPAGSAGDVTVPGGTINVDGTQLKAVKLDAAEVDKLKGAGEPINRLNKADGTVLMQVEAVPGPAAADGWAWKDKVEQLVAVDAKGMQHKCVGAWTVSADGKIVTARFTAGAQVSMTDVTAPAAPPAKIFLAFEVPEGTEIKKIQVGQAPVLGS